jgi:hypothetical protein
MARRIFSAGHFVLRRKISLRLGSRFFRRCFAVARRHNDPGNTGGVVGGDTVQTKIHCLVLVRRAEIHKVCPPRKQLIKE